MTDLSPGPVRNTDFDFSPLSLCSGADNHLFRFRKQLTSEPTDAGK